ncbi:hypothetical protein B0H14DRAFT_2782878 [Mycena olivaceomarginata]|nr:hypothetical protein B0H14DRAFT_2782878 [Mycena olivaceomarginata]
MRGLAIPTSADFDREQSNEYGTEFSNNDDSIPIDPALGGTPIDPTLLEDPTSEQNYPTNTESARTPPPEEPPKHYDHYSQAPQGDPFAPQPEHHPIPEEPPATHPTCLQLGPSIGELIQTYEWVCIECKKCEICLTKGDDARILFCDSCDRGWHMDCLDPPVDDMPVGKWYCPRCPNAVETERGTSVASTSISVATPRTRKGKAKATTPIPTDDDCASASACCKERRGRPKGSKNTQTPKRAADEQTSPVRPAKRIRIRPPNPPAPAPPPTPSGSVPLRIPTGRGRRQEEEEPGLFDEILTFEERDTSKTSIAAPDKLKFENSRARAESKLGPPPPPRQRRMSDPDTPTAGPSSRPLRSSFMQQSQVPSPSASPAPSSASGALAVPHHKHDDEPPPLRISTIRFGQYDIKTWYNAPFPEEYANIPDGRLWICEFCLKYMKSRFGATRHRKKCKSRNPPGDEIYRDQTVSIFEVDGRKNKIYCQNLCLLSKMFLDHKSLFYDVEPFLFYVVTEVDDFGARFVGYFSKEKRSPKDYNVSCIMTLPVRQRQGWGNLLIDFSYLLSKKEGRLGSPEKPLSALGALGYKNYWKLALMRYLATAPDRPRLEDICVATSLTMEDAFTTLVDQEMITPSPGQSIKFPKGRKNGVARRHLQRTQTDRANAGDPEATQGPFVAPTQYEIHWDRDKVAEYLSAWESKGYLQLKPKKLQWSPYILANTQKTEAVSAADTSTLLTSEKLAAKGLLDLYDGEPRAVFPPQTPSGALDETKPDKELATTLAVDTPRTPLATPSRGVLDRPRRGQASEKGKGKEKPLPLPEPDEEEEEEDEASEEEGRQLRSRGYAPGLLLAAQSSPPSTPSRRVPSSKKRRRVESSPEDDASPSMPSEPPRTPSPPVNGVEHPSDSAACTQEPLQRNGLDATRQPVGAPRALNPAAPVIKTIVVQTGGDRNGAVKSEDLGTPLTSLTGRQSDDTVVALDPAPAVNGNGKVRRAERGAWRQSTKETLKETMDDDDRMSEDKVSLGDDDAEGEEDDAEGSVESVDVDMS